MKLNKNLFFYASVIGIFGFLMWIIILQGEKIIPVKNSSQLSIEENSVITKDKISNEKSDGIFDEFINSFLENLHHPLAILLIQIISIIITARIFGYFFKKINQPKVMGEIAAGIFLGPSVVGIFIPEVSGFLFPVQSLGNLQFLSQIGLIFFMFIIGMELDIKALQNKANAAVVISHSSIIFPYFLGVFLAYFLYENYAPADISFLAFALFMGIAMSITAFPVLARIIQERGMTKTSLGAMALTCAAADDITAWCILATVVAIVNAASIANGFFIIVLSLIYLFIMLYLVKPFLNRIGSIYISKENLNKTVVAFIFLILLGSAFITEMIGIHALFGAFLAGAIMPHNLNFKRILIEKIEDISLVVLLPLFFVFTGLRTQIGLLNDINLWLVCLLIIFVAIIGKFGGSAAAAKFVGLSWKDSLSIGALMNTRGLMELIVLNIGYDFGILTPEIFSMMVLMALVTTFLTSPALDLIDHFTKAKYKQIEPSDASFKMLLSFGPPKMGSTLLKLADQLGYNNIYQKEITALHLTPSSEIQPKDALLYEKESFSLIKKTAEELKLNIHTKYKATSEVQKEIINTTNHGSYDLLLVGSAKSPFTEDKLGGKIKNLFEEVNCDLGVLIEKDFNIAKNILLFFYNEKDSFLLSYINDFAKDKSIKIIVLNFNQANWELFSKLPGSIKVIDGQPDQINAANYDLLIASLSCWENIDDKYFPNLMDKTSMLIMKKRK